MTYLIVIFVMTNVVVAIFGIFSDQDMEPPVELSNKYDISVINMYQSDQYASK